MNEKTYEIFYDERADFLEIFIGDSTKCYAEEIEEGIFIRRDKKTNEIKSIDILSFKKRGAQVLQQILNKINISFPLQISA